MQLVLEIKSRDIETKLEKIRARLKNNEPLMAGIAAELLSITEQSFDKESDSDGNKWQSLASSTIRKREKKGQWPGKKLQVSTAGLAASILPFSSNNSAGISSSKPYAAIHQFGGQAGRGKKVTIPARPYMPIIKDGEELNLTANATKSILQMTRDYLMDEL